MQKTPAATIPFAEIRSWMFQSALPLWARIGVDHERAQFVEKTDFAGRPVDGVPRRTRVAGRQTYVFSHAATLGWSDAAEISKLGADLLNRLYLGPEHGWPRTVDAAGAPLDSTPDLYDLAFVLFGFAWRHRAAGDPVSHAGVRHAIDFITTKMRAPQAFWHALPPTGPRLQNPHMHLLEACIAAYNATNETPFLDTARELAALLRSSLFDGQTLAEYFDPDWKRVSGDLGRQIEPGHQFEWAWILVQYAKLTGEDVLAQAIGLTEFAERYGLDPASGRVAQIIGDDGAPIDATSRTWPNTERIKAHLALFEANGRDPREAVARSARVLLDQYLSTATPGLWVDHLDAEGRPLVDTVPASTLYHVFLAFAEILRLESRLVGLDRAVHPQQIGPQEKGLLGEP